MSIFQSFFLIFSGQFFPFSVLSRPILDYISRWLPVSYAADLFRTTLLGIPPELLPNDIGLEWLIVILFDVVSPIVGFLGYRAVERAARRAGTLGDDWSAAQEKGATSPCRPRGVRNLGDLPLVLETGTAPRAPHRARPPNARGVHRNVGARPNPCYYMTRSDI